MSHIKRPLKQFLAVMVMAVFLCASWTQAWAQSRGAPIIIRDTEIEHIFKGWLEPLLKAANMNPESVNIIFVQSPEINAFVAGGANIFIYTGLIDRSETPEEVIGVMAHELGHIAGGHLVSTRQAMERASYESILGMVLGMGAALATGQGDAASAIITGSASMAQRRFLANSRITESSADQAALRYMNAAGINPTGLKTFFQKLESEELLPPTQQSEYMRSHPITRDRVEALATNMSQSPNINTPTPEDWANQHARVKAKLLGFINPGRVPWVYDDRDVSVPARYARAIAAYRENRVDRALKEIDGLLDMEPNNPYFLELKGQMLVGFGRVKDSLPYYRKAVDLVEEPALIRLDLGHALMESRGGDDVIEEAIKTIERALIDEPRSGRGHRLLATAYGRTGREGLAKLHLAEEAVLQRQFPYARRLAESALVSFEQDNRNRIKAQDLIQYIEHMESLSKN